MRIISLILMTLVSMVALILPLSHVYADPSPPHYIPFNWVTYSVEVVVSEAVAWLIGAELLWRLLRKRKQEVSRLGVYGIMLLVMIVSFSVGLVFWKTFGWI